MGNALIYSNDFDGATTGLATLSSTDNFNLSMPITSYPIGDDNSVTPSIGKKDFEIVGASLVGAQKKGQARDLPLQGQN